MRFNWGTGIFIFYTIFALALFYQVYRSTQYDHSLVVENYYEKDLAYQSTYDKLQNSLDLSEKVTVDINSIDQIVALDFPGSLGQIDGSVLLYRANNKKQDVNLPIFLNKDGKMIIPSDKLEKGRWKIEIDWQAGEKQYLDRKVITL